MDINGHSNKWKNMHNTAKKLGLISSIDISVVQMYYFMEGNIESLGSNRTTL